MMDTKTISVGEIMRRDVRTLRDDMTVATAVAALQAARVTGAPVLDGEGRCVGVFSTTDLARRESARRPRLLDEDAMHAPVFFTFDPLSDWGDDVLTASAGTAGGDRLVDWMTRDLRVIAPSASITEACAAMLRERVHRLLVLEEGSLRGIVSAMDIVRMVADSAG